MSDVHEFHPAFHRGTAVIFSLLSSEQTRQLAELQGDPAISERLETLAERATEGDLSAADQAKYEAYIEANNLLAVLQAEARFRLTQGEP